jgi:hypothetical protein
MYRYFSNIFFGIVLPGYRARHHNENEQRHNDRDHDDDH